jgi:hypothetical protein
VLVNTSGTPVGHGFVVEDVFGDILQEQQWERIHKMNIGVIFMAKRLVDSYFSLYN